ncbi:MAG: 3-oxoadipate enol-lactonase [Burkholderiales bacterium]
MHFAKVDGGELHYRMDGTRGKPVLVLSNSLGTDLAMWDPQIGALRAHFCILRYDMRGHGQSAVTPGPYTIEQLGRDVIALLDELGIERASFCGLSLGGIVGQWLGAHAPSRIARLALCNTAPKIGTPDVWNTRIATVEAKGMGAISDALVGRWFTPAFVAREPAVIARMKAMLERQPAQGYVAACAAVRDADLRGEIARIAAPTLVVAGTHDPVTTPADAAFMASLIPDAKVVEVPASHLSNIEASDAFTAALLDFVTRS